MKEIETREDVGQEAPREREMMIDTAGEKREVKEDTGKGDHLGLKNRINLLSTK